MVDGVRAAFQSGKTRSYEWRLGQLEALERGVIERKESILAALNDDLRRDPFIGDLSEVQGVLDELQLFKKNLATWMQGDPDISLPLIHWPGKARVLREPLGTVLIIAPFNYPVRLILFPLMGALAAGNTVVIKPSELTVSCNRMIERLLHDYLDRDAVAVVSGGPAQTTELLRLPFDFIFYTGSANIGKIVMEAAAKHLTPVCLELGGKSPVYVGESANLKVAAKRILWGKFANAGQTCVAPDYVLVHRSREQELLDTMKALLAEWYSDDAQKSADFGRIVNARHVHRLSAALKDSVAQGGSIVAGGLVDEKDLYVAPTIISNPPLRSALMQEEIFGPILPVLQTASADDFVEFVTSRPKPLALYIFSEDQKEIDGLLARTASGGVGINETVFHIALSEMPFGGVGASGFGAYNGKHTFELLSHRKAVLQRSTWSDPELKYPPYTEHKKVTAKRLLAFKLPPLPSLTTTAGIAATSFLSYYLFQRRERIVPAWQHLHSGQARL